MRLAIRAADGGALLADFGDSGDLEEAAGGERAEGKRPANLGAVPADDCAVVG